MSRILRERLDIVAVVLLPLLVFYMAVATYPLEAGEVSTLGGLVYNYTGGLYGAPGYIGAVASLPSYQGLSSGSGRVVRVETGEVGDRPIVRLEIVSGNRTIVVVVTDPELSGKNLRELLGSEAFYRGKVLRIDEREYIVSKIVYISKKTLGGEVRECIYEKRHRHLCEEVMERSRGY